MSLSEWADRYAYLSAVSAAEPGKWRSYGFQRGIMDAITDPLVEQVTVQKSARVGYTKIINHTIGYHIHHDPCPILVVQPTVEDAKGYSNDEIAPMLRDTPALVGLVSEWKSKDTSNTILKKSYPGGVLSLIGANSPRGFRRITVRVVLFDEVDGYPTQGAGNEGDQIRLGRRRTDTYANRKIICGSTPTIAGLSRIEELYGQSDMRRYFVPCPHCGESQTLQWGNLKWPSGQPHLAVFECAKCARGIEHRYKRSMVENGEWIADGPFSGHAGFFIWAAYSMAPHAAWGTLAKEFLEVHTNRDRLQTFVNTILGETWKERGESVDEDPLYARREVYGPEVPEGACMLTAGVDTQDDRLEVEVVAWGPGEESWGMEVKVFYGDPGKDELWKRLDQYLLQPWLHESGIEMRIAAVGVDTGGHYTEQAYRFCKARYGRGVYALKGQGGAGLPLINHVSSRNKGSVKLFSIGVDGAKKWQMFTALHPNTIPGPAYCHFPTTYDQDFFHQLCGEQLIQVMSKGSGTFRWVPKEPGRRVEALDRRIYARAALAILNPSWRAIVENLAARKAKILESPDDTVHPKKKPPPKTGRPGGGFVTGWR